MDTHESAGRRDGGDLDDLAASAPPPREDTNRRRQRALMRRFWRGAAGYWGKDGARLSWLLSAGLLLTILLNLAALYAMNVWTRAIFDGLEQRDSGRVLFLSAIYFPLLAASVCVMLVQVYTRMGTQRRWRAWLNAHLLDRWLKNGRYYQLNLIAGDHKNPEYRIADDIKYATEPPIEFATGLITAILSALTFIVVLWTIGGTLSFQLGNVDIAIPGFLVIAALVYAVLASGSMIVIGRRYVAVSTRKNQAEAEYRYALTRLRENGESIAVLGGEEEERNGVDGAFAAVLRNWQDICTQMMRTTTVSQTSSFYRAGAADHPMCAEVSRRLDDARRGHAGGVRIHHRAERIQLAGRQLSAFCRLERVRRPRRFTDGIARWAGARRERRRLRAHPAQ